MKIYLILLTMLLFSCKRSPVPDEQSTADKIIVYSGDSLRNIAVPVGGIGTGDVLVGGRGNIAALEIFNRPAMGEQPYMTFFSIWYQEEDQPAGARILEGSVPVGTSGPYGIPRRQLEGIPRFSNTEFSARYPLIGVKLRDQEVPLDISGEFYNPLVPLDVDNSSIPVAVFKWTVENTSDREISFSIAFNVGNPLKNQLENGQLVYLGDQNSYYELDGLRGVRFNNREKKGSAHYGDLLMATDFEFADVQTAWYEGAWWDDATVFWDDFAVDGRLKERRESVVWEGSNWYGSDQQSIVGCISANASLAPGESVTIPFYLSWYIPDRILESSLAFGNEEVASSMIMNYYGTKYESAADVLVNFHRERETLYALTRKFTEHLYGGSYPEYVTDAVSSSTAALKTNLLMRTGDGWVHGFEGLGPDAGCCPGNCSHVWNYAQTMAALFPELEQKVREVSFLHDTFGNGYQCFRTVFPLGDYWFTSVAADGQMGNIVRVYREWKNSGDSEWLAMLWPKVRLALEFAWKGSGEVEGKYSWQEHARVPWDPHKEGIMRGDQHNTYDINFFGPNMMTGSLYLAALKACSEMAEAMNDPGKAGEYLDLYQRGSALYDSLLWNGSYYIQKVEVAEGINIPERLKSPPDDEGRILPKYQFADGCLTDQLLGQFIAFNAGLGFIVDSSRVRQAMLSVYENNFIRDFSGFGNVQRVFAVNNESGVVICTWPDGNRPRIPFVYADEVWTGIEYGAAVNMIHAGLVGEGLEIVRAVRERYRGHNRNPWGEIESGMYYARSLASWAVMPALSGFEYDGIEKYIAFDPKINRENFSTFWSCYPAWGKFMMDPQGAEIEVSFGSLVLNSVSIKRAGYRSVRLDEKSVEFEISGNRIFFSEPVVMKAGSTLYFGR
ncbi:MAG: hypothetical protein KFF73_11725 [Cyclobacteriaceae bacterium]|nr:hypothetical protein [Cyclobacteriaceae bacterium]